MWGIFVHRCVYIEVMPTASAWITAGMCINRMYAVLMIHPSVSVRNWVQLISLCDPEMDVMVEYIQQSFVGFGHRQSERVVLEHLYHYKYVCRPIEGDTSQLLMGYSDSPVSPLWELIYSRCV